METGHLGQWDVADPWRPAGSAKILFSTRCLTVQEVPSRLLEGFEGVLYREGYAGYNQVCRDNRITRIKLLGPSSVKLSRPARRLRPC